MNMAKKKAAAASQRARRAPTAKPKEKKSARAGKRTAATRPSVVKKTSRRGSAARVKTVSLGRPLVSGDEKLHFLFKDDYHARQVFDFLRVETVRELEQFSYPRMLDLLSRPVQNTLARIREKLAEKKRHLLDDREFAVAHQLLRSEDANAEPKGSMQGQS
jgi:hypothetical protein